MNPYPELWHSRFGHMSFAAVHEILRNNDMPYDHKSSTVLVCDACQQAKSHQLPFPRSSSVSSNRLGLAFPGVWALAIKSV